jgi:hypothetical protein
MSCTPFLAKPILTARDAIASHVRWKVTLLTAARMHEPLSDCATHSMHTPGKCAIHPWLRSQYNPHLRRTPEYRAVLHWHQEFHREILAAANLINAGEFLAAEQFLHTSETFQSASASLASAIVALDRIAPPTPRRRRSSLARRPSTAVRPELPQVVAPALSEA